MRRFCRNWVSSLRPADTQVGKGCGETQQGFSLQCPRDLCKITLVCGCALEAAVKVKSLRMLPGCCNISLGLHHRECLSAEPVCRQAEWRSSIQRPGLPLGQGPGKGLNMAHVNGSGTEAQTTSGPNSGEAFRRRSGCGARQWQATGGRRWRRVRPPHPEAPGLRTAPEAAS